MRTFVADVADFRDQILGQPALYVEIPLLRIARFVVAIDNVLILSEAQAPPE